jgi:bacterioferritin (cytochrome b1)
MMSILKRKRFTTILLVGAMVFNVFLATANASELPKDLETNSTCIAVAQNWEDVDGDCIECEPLTFEEFIEDMKEEMSKEDLTKAESLYNQLTTLDEQENFDEAEKIWKQLDTILRKYEKPLTFDELFGDMKEDMSNDDWKKAESLYNQVINLENKENFDEADKTWDQLDDIIIKYIKEPTFEELFSDVKEEISKDDWTKAETLYTQIVELEKQEKFDEADKVWEKFDNILSKYFEEKDDDN